MNPKIPAAKSDNKASASSSNAGSGPAARHGQQQLTQKVVLNHLLKAFEADPPFRLEAGQSAKDASGPPVNPNQILKANIELLIEYPPSS
jgi:hypothetical protein